MTKPDPHSYAVPAEAKVEHLNWTATVDFDSKIITARAAWNVKNEGKADSIRLDTKDLLIKQITLDDGAPAKYRLGVKDHLLGQALVVAIKPGTKTISIDYETSPEAEALQWLGPQQTAGKTHPFLFTQSQTILPAIGRRSTGSPGV